jgi:hypothetical protein
LTIARFGAGKLWVVIVGVGVVLIVAGGVAVGASRRRHQGLSVSQVLSGSSQSSSRVIVLLRNQHANLPPTQARVAARVHAVSSDQQPSPSRRAARPAAT